MGIRVGEFGVSEYVGTMIERRTRLPGLPSLSGVVVSSLTWSTARPGADIRGGAHVGPRTGLLTGPIETATATAVLVGAAFGLAGVLIGPISISSRTRPRAFRGLATALVPTVVWLLCGGPVVPTMLAFCAATLALGEWRVRYAVCRKVVPDDIAGVGQ